MSSKDKAGLILLALATTTIIVGVFAWAVYDISNRLQIAFGVAAALQLCFVDALLGGKKP